MGIGDTVSHVLMHPVFWENPQQAAREVWIKRNKNAAANGGVMRTAVLGVPSFGNIDTVLTNTDAVCQVTHADPRCRASCAAVAAAVALMLQGQTDVNAIIEAALAHAAKQVEDPTELRKFGISSLASMDLGERSSIGYLQYHVLLMRYRYTYKCFGSGFWALRQNNFADALSDITLEAGGAAICCFPIWRLISSADADTNGAVAGALLGCRLGFAQLPQRWLDGLVHSAWLREKAEQLCQLVGV